MSVDEDGVITRTWASRLDRKAEPIPTRPPSARVVPIDSAQGHKYAVRALQLEAEIVASAPDGTRNDALNKAAFRLGRHVGAGSIEARLVRDTLASAGRSAGLGETEISLVLRDSPDAALNQGQAHPRIPTPDQEIPAATVFEPSEAEVVDFWAARPLLAHLHQFARARRVSPWAVLGVTLARIVTATPPHRTLPPIVGHHASLNLFVGLVGSSGSGKGAAEGVAEEAFDVGYIETLTTGSGEGIAHGYKKRVKNDVEWLNESHAVLFSIPEIDTLTALGDRKGATLMPELRRGWSGERLGFAYADPTKRLPVEAHQYRMCLVAGIQPTRAGALLDDTDGGTPQRFIWLPAWDADAPDAAPEAPRPMTWRPPGAGGISTAHGLTPLGVCPVARDTIDAARLARLRGQGDALDGHALLAQLKVAAALALAERRLEVTEEDWILADVIMRKSAATRASVVQTMSDKVERTNTARGEAEAGRAVTVAEGLEDAALKRVCTSVRRKVHAGGEVLKSEVRRAVAARDRALFEDAVDRLVEAGAIRQTTDERGVILAYVDDERA